MTQPAVRALFSFRWGRRTIYVLPLRSLAYGLVSLAIVLGVLLALDRLVLASLERGGWTSGQLWQRHNQLVELNQRRSTTTNECELRHWQGEPLPKVSGTLRVPSSADSRDLSGDGTRSVPATIFVLGDSFVWGPPYQSLNHLWWRQLAIELERRGYREVNIVAAGHPGYSTRRQLQCAGELLPQVQPDLLIWGYVTNDPDEKLVRQIFNSQDDSPFPQRIRVRLKWLLPNLMFKFESLRADNLAAHYAGPEYGYLYHDWERKLLEGENFEQYGKTVSEAGRFLRESKTPAFLQTLPSWPCREHYELRYAPVLPLWKQAGVPVHNTLDEFTRRYGNAPASGPEAIRWGINPADSHPGPRATHFHAVMAADYLERHHAELLGRKDTKAPHELKVNDWLPFDLNVRPQGREFLLDYPSTTEFMPTLPLAEPTAMVALRYPLPLAEIRLSGSGLQSARIWISTLDPVEHYDLCQWRELSAQAGPECTFRLPPDLAGQDVTAIRFAADVSGDDRELKLMLLQETAAEVQP
jgi:hypothetical protein